MVPTTIQYFNFTGISKVCSGLLHISYVWYFGKMCAKKYLLGWLEELPIIYITGQVFSPALENAFQDVDCHRLVPVSFGFWNLGVCLYIFGT